MIPENATRRPGKGVVSSSAVPSQRQSTRQPHVRGTLFTIRGSRGGDRALIVVRCPYCSADHIHSGKADFVQGNRRASCYLGRYTVIAGRTGTTPTSAPQPRAS